MNVVRRHTSFEELTPTLLRADAAQCGIAWFAISLEHAVPQVQRGQEVTGRVRIPVATER